ncbi:MAG TPA: RNA polymerase sigma factor [Blastocatellia bacterium]|jgi:DNA-directed RNA polymerase specialized sigma24 family protein|nr:RNA polymerase sigma factor [Blastocatellia bacterium]
MRKDWELTKEAFDKFLSWLHPDREEAGKKYEDIRHHLIIILTCRGCSDAEELADETINRVIRRAQQMADTYQGEPAPYFITVAHNLFLEYVSKRPGRSELPPELPQQPDPDPDEGREYDCLDQCMQELKPGNRDLVLRYYREDKQAKIDHRKRLADEMGIAPNALRIRAHRIRLALQECIDKCLAN